MDYNGLYLAFKNTFPEDSELFREWETKNSLGPDDPEMMHVYFGLIVTPYVVSLAKEKQLEKLKKAFQFFEDMAKDTDNEVQGVLQFSVLENLISEKKERSFFARKMLWAANARFNGTRLHIHGA